MPLGVIISSITEVSVTIRISEEDMKCCVL